MRKLTVIVVFCVGLFSVPALAGPGHEHGHGHSHGPVSSDVAANKAMTKVEQLVKSGKVDASWSGIQPASVEQKTYANGPEWVVTFNNDKISDASKRTLYLFYSLNGHYIAANYTGQ